MFQNEAWFFYTQKEGNGDENQRLTALAHTKILCVPQQNCPERRKTINPKQKELREQTERRKKQ